MTERGKVLSRKAIGESADADADSGIEGTDALYGLNFPDRDLKPGDSWEDAVSVGVEGEARKVRMSTRFVRWETFRGIRCARFATTLTVPQSTEGITPGDGLSTGLANKVSATVTTYFDPKKGTELYSRGSLAMVGRADLSGVTP